MKMKQHSDGISTGLNAVQTIATKSGSILNSKTVTEVESIVGDCDAPTSSTVLSPPNAKLEMYNELLEPNNISAKHTDAKHNLDPVFQISYLCEQCDFR